MGNSGLAGALPRHSAQTDLPSGRCGQRVRQQSASALHAVMCNRKRTFASKGIQGCGRLASSVLRAATRRCSPHHSGPAHMSSSSMRALARARVCGALAV